MVLIYFNTHEFIQQLFGCVFYKNVQIVHIIDVVSFPAALRHEHCHEETLPLKHFKHSNSCLS